MQSRTRYIFLLMTGAAFISLSSVFVKLSTDTGNITIGFYRMLFGGLFLLPIAIIKRQKLFNGWKPVLWTTFAGLFFALDLTFYHYSINYIGPGLATLISNFQVFLMALAGYFIFKEKISSRLFIAIPLALAGIFLLCGIKWNNLPEFYHMGVLFGFLTSIVYVGYMLCLRQPQFQEKKLDVIPMMIWVCATTCIFMAIQTLFVDEKISIPKSPDIYYLVLYGVLSQGIAWVLISISLPKLKTSITGLLLLLQPTLAMTWDIIFFKRPTGYLDYLGIIIAIFAIYLGATSKKQERIINGKKS